MNGTFQSLRLKPLRIIVSLLLLVATVVGATWLILHYVGGKEKLLLLLRQITLRQWGGLLALTALFYFLDYVRWYTLLSLLGYHLTPWEGLRLTCVSYSVSTVTPSMELHLPFMVFLLMRKGIPGPKATAVSMIKSLYMVLWICIFSWATLQWQHEVHLPETISKNIFYYTLPLAVFIVLFFLVIFFPGRIHAWADRQRQKPSLAGWMKRCIAGFDHWAEAFSAMGRSTHPMHLACHLAAVLFLGVYIAIGYFLCGIFGITLSWEKAVTVFSNSLMVAYLAPVPGSMGVSEFVTNYLLDPSLTSQGMTVSALLRFLCWYSAAILGAPWTVFLLFRGRLFNSSQGREAL